MKPGRGVLLILSCFFLSGLSGLVYQTAWLRQFALVFGTSELALATVLAAYMAGLAVGAAAAGRWATRVRRPVLLYAVLELGIGISALLVPVAIDLASRLQVLWLGGSDLPPEAGSPASALLYLVSSFAILLVPAGLMGATLPLLARWAVRSESEIGPNVGVLYTANTAGAAAGTLCAAFVLLPRLGLGATVLVGAAVNFFIFILVALLARGAGLRPAERASGEARGKPSPGFHWVLPVVLFSGIVSFALEVLWTRLLSHLVGGSVYAFASMLATFLVGLALGSALAGRLASTPERARLGLAVSQLAVGGSSLAAFAVVDRLPPLARILALGGDELLLSGAALAGATLLPVAIAIGATFPFAVRCLAADAADAPRATARVFAWNTVGAVVGSLATGYLILPELGFSATAASATALSLLLALVAALAGKPRRRVLAAVGLAGLLVLPLVRPGTPWTVLRYGPLGNREAGGSVTYHAVGRSANVMLFEHPWGWSLTTNGLPESMIERRSARPGRAVVARWLSLLAVAARPELRSLLVVGLGAGVTVEDVPASVSEIHVVELEPRVVDANRRVSARRRSDPLADPRLQIHVNDARGALRLTGRSFGAIVSQPSHPWTSGASHLFTREFLALVRARLTPTGVFVQWMGLPFVDEQLLRAMVATAVAEFPHVEVYMPATGGILLVASPEELRVAATAPRAIAAAPETWRPFGVLRAEDLLASRVLDAQGSRDFAGGARPITDSRNLFQTRSPRILREPLGDAAAARLLAPFDPFLAMPEGVDPLYLLRRILRLGQLDRASRLVEALPAGAQRHAAAGLVKLVARDVSGGEFELRAALGRDPSSREALAGLLALYRPAIQGGESVAFADRVSTDPGAAVVAGWRHGGAGAWGGVAELDERLAAVESWDPFFAAASRLRAQWRVESGEAARAVEVYDLLEPLISPLPAVPDLLLRARAAVVAGDVAVALSTLSEALPRFQRGTETAAEWDRIFRSLPRDESEGEWRRELERRFRRPPMEEEITEPGLG